MENLRKFRCKNCDKVETTKKYIQCYCSDCENTFEKDRKRQKDLNIELNKTRLDPEDAIEKMIAKKKADLDKQSKEELIERILRSERFELESLGSTDLANRSGAVLGVFTKIKIDD
jgi:threonine synthase